MIIEEAVQGHPDLVKRYSDQGFLIQNDQTGGKYEEAVDIVGLYTYTETDEYPEGDEDISDTEALNIIMGRDQDEPDNGEEVPEAD